MDLRKNDILAQLFNISSTFDAKNWNLGALIIISLGDYIEKICYHVFHNYLREEFYGLVRKGLSRNR